MKIETITTEDGSSSFFVPALDETYHSVHGAWNESYHVFIKNGFHIVQETTLSILEIGFGTGLNALQTSLEAQKNQIPVSFTTLENFPIPKEWVAQLNYDQKAQEFYQSEKTYFQELHNAKWNETENIHSFFKLQKIEETVQNWQVIEKHFNLIYFDAFAPNKQEEMWTEEIFQKMFDSLKNGGLLTTYCAKGSVKRMLKSVGFRIKNVPGPPGKREMTLAFKD
ncbi:MAG: tRNA (5-methylaminomethyl-2-thiouridine)(34)-methyltransferase MnmD [Flavobacteriales bacterium]|jgi:tRNA U34 5-methylaminomethyl-2-thiouridine-forming methyltransferase MnmC|nr:tRNA (5-methylaminomethyl-2-thiouridine)(34)-methyltransferase MnmD [Flavobacteriales bacterium]